MVTDKEFKQKMLAKFSKHYKRYYPVKTLDSLGYKRHICSSCGMGFWSMEKRNTCDEPACSNGYRFIGESLTWKKLGYTELWDIYTDVMKKWKYKPIKRYPVVARWYDQLYYVTAGINNFQPYVVSGAVPPPYQATLEPQFCLRFNDIDNVGLTGGHYSGFVMVGQHVFNTPDNHLYFKEKSLKHMYKFFRKGMGIKKDELILHESIWAGGGNFGPSIEFFSRGLELANQVYIQYGSTGKGEEELRTRVIDMGASLERWAWFSNGIPMSYDVVFPKVMKYLYNHTGIKPKKSVWKKFVKYGGMLNIDEGGISKRWETVSRKVGIDSKMLKKEIFPVRALYSLADHTRTLLVAIHDGSLPSNVGGGYNLRNLLRRCFSLIDEYNLKIDLKKLFQLHMDEFGSWKEYENLHEAGSLFDILKVEKQRYDETRKRGRAVITNLLQKKKTLGTDEFIKLYESHGINPELVKEIKPEIEIPANFYAKLDKLHEPKPRPVKEYDLDLTKIPNTVLSYYYTPNKFDFNAKVIKIAGNRVILDQTMFYPKSGGQDYDLGTINKIPLKSVEIFHGTVIHEIESKPNFKIGDRITGKVDKERRKKLMSNHTGAHILGYACRKILGPHIHQEGAEKKIEKGRLDVTHYESISFEDRQAIERMANSVIKKGLSVTTEFMDRDKAEKKYGMGIYQGGAVPGKEIRILKIGKLDIQACGGTHVNNTKKIKFLKIINTERIKDGIVRIEYMTGDAAIKDVQKQERILKKLAELWSIPFDKVPQTAERFFREWKSLKNQVKDVQRKVASEMIRWAVENNVKKIKIPVDEFSVVQKALGPYKNKVRDIMIIGNDFAIALSSTDAVSVLKPICKTVKGNKKEAHGFKLK
jgi:alanyl-tRNA synthetase